MFSAFFLSFWTDILAEDWGVILPVISPQSTTVVIEISLFLPTEILFLRRISVVKINSATIKVQGLLLPYILYLIPKDISSTLVNTKYS